MEPIAAIAIGVLIIKVAVDIYMQSIRELIDTAADPETLEDIREIIMETSGVILIDDLKTRIHVNRLYVDVEIAVNADLTLRDAHHIAEDVHDRIEGKIPKVKHCMVHVNPHGEG
jgi:divalent metal cation (Fe/Co/Zn/Cd) transporter